MKSWAPAPPTRAKEKTRGPKRGRKQGSFGTHRRLSKLRDALDKQPSGLTLEEIADALSVTTRSVRRYLVELGRWGAELESIETAPGGAQIGRASCRERG